MRDLTQLRSCTLYADIKAEIRNEASYQVCYGCSHLYSGAREIKLVKSVYICTTEISSKTIRNHKSIRDSSMLQILVADYWGKYMSSK